jgi:hypothetical protein
MNLLERLFFNEVGHFGFAHHSCLLVSRGWEKKKACEQTFSKYQSKLVTWLKQVFVDIGIHFHRGDFHIAHIAIGIHRKYDTCI